MNGDNDYIRQLRGILVKAMTALDHGNITTGKLSEAAGLLTVVSEELNIAKLTAIANINSIDDMTMAIQGLESDSFTLMQALASFELAREEMNKVQQNLQVFIDKVDAMHTSLELGTIDKAMKDSKAAFYSGTEGLRQYIREIQ